MNEPLYKGVRVNFSKGVYETMFVLSRSSAIAKEHIQLGLRAHYDGTVWATACGPIVPCSLSPRCLDWFDPIAPKFVDVQCAAVRHFSHLGSARSETDIGFLKKHWSRPS